MGKQLSYDLMENFLSYNDPQLTEGRDNRQQLAGAKKLLRQVIQNDLTTRQKQIILLYFGKRMNMTEIANLLQVNKSTVSRTLRRALDRLEKYLRYYQFR